MTDARDRDRDGACVEGCYSGSDRARTVSPSQHPRRDSLAALFPPTQAVEPCVEAAEFPEAHAQQQQQRDVALRRRGGLQLSRRRRNGKQEKGEDGGRRLKQPSQPAVQDPITTSPPAPPCSAAVNDMIACGSRFSPAPTARDQWLSDPRPAYFANADDGSDEDEDFQDYQTPPSPSLQQRATQKHPECNHNDDDDDDDDDDDGDGDSSSDDGNEFEDNAWGRWSRTLVRGKAGAKKAQLVDSLSTGSTIKGNAPHVHSSSSSSNNKNISSSNKSSSNKNNNHASSSLLSLSAANKPPPSSLTGAKPTKLMQKSASTTTPSPQRRLTGFSAAVQGASSASAQKRHKARLALMRETVSCPICHEVLTHVQINQHLDECLRNTPSSAPVLKHSQSDSALLPNGQQRHQAQAYDAEEWLLLSNNSQAHQTQTQTQPQTQPQTPPSQERGERQGALPLKRAKRVSSHARKDDLGGQKSSTETRGVDEDATLTPELFQPTATAATVTTTTTVAASRSSVTGERQRSADPQPTTMALSGLDLFSSFDAHQHSLAPGNTLQSPLPLDGLTNASPDRADSDDAAVTPELFGADVSPKRSECAMKPAPDQQSHPIRGSRTDATCCAAAEEDDEATRDCCYICQEADHFASDCPQGPYYRYNFELVVLHGVSTQDNYLDLFNQHDRQVLTQYEQLCLSAKLLFIRLYNRKHRWLPASKISYPKISSDLGPVLKQLLDVGFLQSLCTVSSLPHVLGTLSFSQLSALTREFQLNGKGALTRRAIIDLFERTSARQRTVSHQSFGSAVVKRAKALAGLCVRVAPAVRNIVTRHEVLFFMLQSIAPEYATGVDSSMSSMACIYLASKGAIRYPEFRVWVSQPFFQSREQLINYTVALHQEAAWENAIMEARSDMDMLAMLREAIRDISCSWDRQIAADVEPDRPAAFQLPPFFAAGQELSAANAAQQPLSEETHDMHTRASEQDSRCRSKNCMRERPSLPSPSPSSSSSSSPLRRLFTMMNVYTRMLSSLSAILDRLHDYAGSALILRKLLDQHVYLCETRGRWYDRLALLNSEHLGDPMESLRLCELGLRDPHVKTGHRLALQRRAARLCASAKFPQLHEFAHLHPKPQLVLGDHILLHGRAIPDREAGRKMTFIHNDQSLSSVEEFVLAQFAQEGWKGVHSEGAVLRTIFGLLFWEIIYADIDNVFLTKYQVAPIDLNTPDFWRRRKTLFRKRLRELKHLNLSAEIQTRWDRYHGRTAVGVSWTILSRDDLAAAATCIGHEVLAGVCNVFAREYRHRAGGLPDLFLWKENVFAEEANGGDGVESDSENPDEPLSMACFVEVKSPNDVLSDKQKIWLHVLSLLGANAALCEVQDYAGRKAAIFS